MKLLCFSVLLSALALPYADRFLIIETKGRAGTAPMSLEQAAGAQSQHSWKGLTAGTYIYPSSAVRCGGNSSVILLLGEGIRLCLDEKSFVWLNYSTAEGKNQYDVYPLLGRISVERPYAPERTSRNIACSVYIKDVTADLKSGTLLADVRKFPKEYYFIQAQGASIVYPPNVSRENPVPRFQFFNLSNAQMAHFISDKPAIEKPYYPDRTDWEFAYQVRGWKSTGMIEDSGAWE